MLREPWRTRLLFLSFAVNLVTIPLAVTMLLPHVRPRPQPGGGPRTIFMVERMARDLPEGDAKRFRAVVEPRVPDIEVSRARMEAARAAMARTMDHTPYDEAAVRASLVVWQKAWTDWTNDFTDAVLAAINDVSPEGRHRLARIGMRRPPPP